MLPELIIGNDIEHVTIVFLNYPNKEGWLDVIVSVSVGAWRGKFDTQFETRDLVMFCQQLEALYSSATNAQFITREDQIRLNFQKHRLGQISINGSACDFAGTGNQLKFELPEFDQTFLPIWIGQLKEILAWIEQGKE